MKKIISLFTILCCVNHLFAQQYTDIGKVYFNNSAVNKFENSDVGTRVQEIGMDLTMPILVNANDALLTGLFYENTRTKLYADEPEELLTIAGVRLGFAKKHSEKWSGSYMLIPKMASDFEDVSRKDFQLGAIALLKYNKTVNFNYKVGMYYNSEVFGPIIIPLFGIYKLSANKKFETNLTLPFLADFNYRLHKYVQVGFNFSGQIRSYHLSNIQESTDDGYVVKKSNELFAYLKFNLSKSVSIYTRAGYSIGRSYRVFDESDRVDFASILITVGDERQQLNTDFSDGFLLQTILLYRFIHKK